MSKVIFIVLLIIIIALFIGRIISKAMMFYRMKKYGRVSVNIFLEKYYLKYGSFFLKNKLVNEFTEFVAYRLSSFNTNPFEKNKQISLFIIFSYSIFVICILIVCVIYFWPFWYIAFMYLIFINVGIFMLAILVMDSIMNSYIKKLPETIKILQSRFLSKGSITKAIHVSISDLPKGIKSEMIRIYDALKQNEVYKAKEIFHAIDMKYSNEHMSVLLDLIWLAHYNGGDETIKGQFESMLNDVLEDMENQQDLKGAAMSYIIMSAVFIGALPLVKMYNGTILSSEEMEYYSSRGSLFFVALYIAFILIFIGILFYLKKKG